MSTIGVLDGAVHALADLRNYLPTPSPPTSPFLPTQGVDFPKTSLCGKSPIDMISKLQMLCLSAPKNGNNVARFPPNVSRTLDVPFWKGLLALGSQHESYEKWFLDHSSLLGPESSQHRKIVSMAELDNPTVLLSIRDTMTALILHLVRVAVKSRPDLSTDFMSLGGIHVVLDMISNVRSERVQLKFLEAVYDFSYDPAMLKCMIAHDYLSIIFTLMNSKNAHLHGLTIFLLFSMREDTDARLLLKHTKSRDCSLHLKAMIDETDPQLKVCLTKTIASIVNSVPSSRDEFIKPSNVGPFLQLLNDLLLDKDQMLWTRAGMDKKEDCYSDRALVTSMIHVLGFVSFGSTERSIVLDQVVPLLMPTLSKIIDIDLVACSEIIKTIFSILTFLDESEIQILQCTFNVPLGLISICEYICRILNNISSEADWNSWSYGLKLIRIIMNPFFKHEIVVPVMMREGLWRCYVALVTLYDSPRAANLCLETVDAIHTFFSFIFSLPVEPVYLSHWIQRYSLQTGYQHIPFLSVIVGMRNGKGRSYINFPPHIMTRLCSFFNECLDCVRYLLPRVHGLVNESTLRQFDWICMILEDSASEALSSTTTVTATATSTTSNTTTTAAMYNPIVTRDKKCKDGYKISASGSDSRLCGDPSCCRHQNLKACSRCRTEYYCSSNCQNRHWPEHKKVCNR